MIEVQSLSRYYGDFAAIEDLSFQIQNKQVVGFLGLNGAGKSTTLKILATLLSPSSGSVVIDGNNYDDTSIAFRSQIGFLPEEPPLYREMTVQSFLKHVAMLRKMSKDSFWGSPPHRDETMSTHRKRACSDQHPITGISKTCGGLHRPSSIIPS